LSPMTMFQSARMLRERSNATKKLQAKRYMESSSQILAPRNMEFVLSNSRKKLVGLKGMTSMHPFLKMEGLILCLM